LTNISPVSPPPGPEDHHSALCFRITNAVSIPATLRSLLGCASPQDPASKWLATCYQQAFRTLTVTVVNILSISLSRPMCYL
jgi:hypothetical protein